MRIPKTLLLAVAVAGVAGGLSLRQPAAAVAADAPATAAAIDFNRDIRPILSDNCFTCHGPDGENRKGGLRLDVRADALKPAKSGAAAIVAGKPAQSELIKRVVLSADDDDVMPPEKANKKPLSAGQVDLLKRWVAQGASYQGHWAFTPPVRPALPGVKDEKWVRTPIDRFVLAKLEAERLSPSPEAQRATLLRRLYLDLLGLPPTVEQVDAFLADESPDAYAKQVEKLLASPHYGERWGRHWLDAARYADSDGFEKDKSRQVWFYRDYVINAFNCDLPYDQFLVEQLAGDLLPNATQDQVVATGFLRNSMINEEGGVDPEQFRMDAMFDRMDAVGKAMLGLTIQCAQCHTHKYDPITHEEYYRLFAFLNNDHEAQRVVYAPDEQMRVAELTRQMREIEARLRGQTPDWQARMESWEEQVKRDQPEWTVLELENLGDNSQRYLPQPDGSILAQGYAPTKFRGSFKAATKLKNVTALRLEYLTDPNLPCGGPGRSFKGTCALTDVKVDALPADGKAKPERLKIVEATSDINPPEAPLEPNYDDRSNVKRVTGPIAYAIDGDDKTAWGIDAGPGRRNQERKAVFRFEKPATADAGVTLKIDLVQNHGGWNSDDHMNHNLGRFRVSATSAENAKADPLPKRVRDLLAIPRGQRTPAQTAAVFSYWRTTVPQFKAANDQIEALWKQWPEGSTSLTLMPREGGRETHLLARGDWLKPAKPVTAGVPAFLNPLPEGAPANRLTLAKWLVDPKAPTTARVFVNRVWQAYFGLGIVGTSEDFGVQSEQPSHPELLDWLAVEFMERGWSVKHLHRLIVNSATYRQSSRVSKELYAKDPYNRLLARAPRLRVEGEIVRDIALAASGLLNPKVGGRSVMPPAPAFLFQPPASYAPFPWVDETGPEKYRRALYTFRRRSTPYPVLQTFDVPNADQSCVRRLRSNSPLQALASLNEPMFVEAARALAKVTLEQGGKSDDDRLAYAFRRVTARPPTDAERQVLAALLDKQRRRFADGWLNPAELTTGADKAVPAADAPKGASPTQWAAYTVVARVLLNLDETITKE
jgi:mono/diheme cytochrome c family protein